MGIVRVEKKKNFSCTSNIAPHSKELSLKAKGLLWYLLTLPDDWEIKITYLSSIMKEGKTAIETTIKELIQTGYATKGKKLYRNGKFNGYNYTIHEEPIPINRDGKHVTENPALPSTNVINTNIDTKVSSSGTENTVPLKSGLIEYWNDLKNTSVHKTINSSGEPSKTYSQARRYLDELKKGKFLLSKEFDPDWIKKNKVPLNKMRNKKFTDEEIKAVFDKFNKHCFTVGYEPINKAFLKPLKSIANFLYSNNQSWFLKLAFNDVKKDQTIIADANCDNVSASDQKKYEYVLNQTGSFFTPDRKLRLKKILSATFKEMQRLNNDTKINDQAKYPSYLGTPGNIKPFIATHCEYLSSHFGGSSLSIGTVRHDGEVWNMFSDWVRKEKNVILHPTGAQQKQIDRDLEYNRKYIERMSIRKEHEKEKALEGVF